MAKAGIATNVHYKPLPMFSAYRAIGFNVEDFPNSINQYCNEISLPLHTRLTTDEVEYIVKTVEKIMACIVG